MPHPSRNFLAFLCLWTGMSLVQHAVADEVTVTAEPGWVKPVEQPAVQDGKSTQHSNGVAYVVVDFQTRYHEGNISYYEHFVTRALNTSGVPEIARISVDFDPLYQSVKVHRIDVLRDGKRIDMLERTSMTLLQREEELEYQVYDGAKTLNMLVEDVQVGDAIEYSLSVDGLNPVYDRHVSLVNRMQWSVPVARVHHRLVLPADHKINIKNIATDIAPGIASIGNTVEYTWQRDDVPALITDEDYPSWYMPYASVYVSDMQDWQEVVDWAMPMYQPVLHSPLLDTVVDKINREAGSDEQKILAALRYAQDDIRYLGIEMGAQSHRPNDPDKVISQRFGDCKDKSRLLTSMIRAMGLEANQALVHSEQGKALDRLAPSPSAFDHAIVRVRLNGRNYWLDPTRTYQAGGLDDIYQRDFGYALLIAAQDGGLKKMADDVRAVYRKSTHEEFDLRGSETGPASYTVTSEYKNYFADEMRQQVSETNHERIKQDYLGYLANFYPDISASKDIQVSDDTKNNVLKTVEEYSIENIWTEGNSENYVNAAFYPSLMLDHIVKPESPFRTMPYSLTHPVHYEQTTRIKLPDGFVFEDTLDEVTDDAFYFARKVDFKDNVLTISYTYKTTADMVAPDKFRSYVKNVDLARDLCSFEMQMLKPGIEIGKFEPQLGDINWGFVAFALASLVLSVFVVFRFIYTYDPPYTAPTDINNALVGLGGWMILPTLGLIAEPFVLLVQSMEFGYIFSATQWSIVTENFDAASITAWIGAELFVMIFRVVMAVGLLALLFQRRHTFPKLYVIYFIAAFVFLIVDNIIGYYLLEQDSLEDDDIRQITRGLVGTLIWCSYMLKSERVRSTFTRRRTEPAPELNPEPDPAG